MTFSSWLLFASVALVASLTPGPAILLATSHSYAYGLRRSTFTMLGNISGLLVMSSLSVAGLSAIILHSAAIFTVVKWLGAAYLVYLGINLIRNGFSNRRPDEIEREPTRTPSAKRLYLHGLMVALSNPKAIAFTTALFPQFIDQSAPVWPQFAILVITFMLLSFSCLLGYGYLSAGARSRLSAGRTATVVSKVFGVIFIVTGGLLAGTSARS